jgi:flagellar protein FliS
MSTNYTLAYKINDVGTANRVKLVVMLYEGAIRFLKEAKKRIETNDIAGRSMYLSKALRIIGELHGSLNLKDGGEIAEQLDKLYSFISSQITLANVSGKAVHIDDSLNVLETLRDGWSQVMKNPEARPMVLSEASYDSRQRVAVQF